MPSIERIIANVIGQIDLSKLSGTPLENVIAAARRLPADQRTVVLNRIFRQPRASAETLARCAEELAKIDGARGAEKVNDLLGRSDRETVLTALRLADRPWFGASPEVAAQVAKLARGADAAPAVRQEAQRALLQLDTDDPQVARAILYCWADEPDADMRSRFRALARQDDPDAPESVAAAARTVARDLWGDDALGNWDMLARLRRELPDVDVSAVPLWTRVKLSSKGDAPHAHVMTELVVCFWYALLGLLIVWLPLAFLGLGRIQGSDLNIAFSTALAVAALAALVVHRLFQPMGVSPDRLGVLASQLVPSVAFGVAFGLVSFAVLHVLVGEGMDAVSGAGVIVSVVIASVAFGLIRPMSGLAFGFTAQPMLRWVLQVLFGAIPSFGLMVLATAYGPLDARGHQAMLLILAGPATLAVSLACARLDATLSETDPTDRRPLRFAIAAAPVLAGAAGIALLAMTALPLVGHLTPAPPGPDDFIAEGGPESRLLRLRVPEPLAVALRQGIRIAPAAGQAQSSEFFLRLERSGTGPVQPDEGTGRGFGVYTVEPGLYSICVTRNEEPCDGTPHEGSVALGAFSEQLALDLDPAGSNATALSYFARIEISATGLDEDDGDSGATPRAARDGFRGLVAGTSDAGGSGYFVATGSVGVTQDGNSATLKHGSLLFRGNDTGPFVVVDGIADADIAPEGVDVEPGAEGAGGLAKVDPAAFGQTVAIARQFLEMSNAPLDGRRVEHTALSTVIGAGADRLRELIEDALATPTDDPAAHRLFLVRDGGTAGLFETDPEDKSAVGQRLVYGWSASPSLDFCYNFEEQQAISVHDLTPDEIRIDWGPAIAELRELLDVTDLPLLDLVDPPPGGSAEHPECVDVRPFHRVVPFGQPIAVELEPGGVVRVRAEATGDIVIRHWSGPIGAVDAGERIDRDPLINTEVVEMFNDMDRSVVHHFCVKPYSDENFDPCLRNPPVKLADTPQRFRLSASAPADFGDIPIPFGDSDDSRSDAIALSAFEAWLVSLRGDQGDAGSWRVTDVPLGLASPLPPVRRGALLAPRGDSTYALVAGALGSATATPSRLDSARITAPGGTAIADEDLAEGASLFEAYVAAAGRLVGADRAYERPGVLWTLASGSGGALAARVAQLSTREALAQPAVLARIGEINAPSLVTWDADGAARLAAGTDPCVAPVRASTGLRIDATRRGADQAGPPIACTDELFFRVFAPGGPRAWDFATSPDANPGLPPAEFANFFVVLPEAGRSERVVAPGTILQGTGDASDWDYAGGQAYFRVVLGYSRCEERDVCLIPLAAIADLGQVYLPWFDDIPQHFTQSWDIRDQGIAVPENWLDQRRAFIEDLSGFAVVVPPPTPLD